MSGRLLATLVFALGLVTACTAPPRAPLPLAGPLDLPRFMGDWYVIAHIPTFIERKATDAVESYRLAADGTIETTFRFREGDAAGPLREYHPRGFVVPDTGNAVWGMQFIWPIRADYRIMALAPDYSWTLIGREARDYVWLMARQPTLAKDTYAEAMQRIQQAGYPVEAIRQVPQSRR